MFQTLAETRKYLRRISNLKNVSCKINELLRKISELNR